MGFEPWTLDTTGRCPTHLANPAPQNRMYTYSVLFVEDNQQEVVTLNTPWVCNEHYTKSSFIIPKKFDKGQIYLGPKGLQ